MLVDIKPPAINGLVKDYFTDISTQVKRDSHQN